MVTVENIRTGVKSTFTDAEWAGVQSKKMWADTFKVVSTENPADQKKTEVPKEVADLQEDKTAQTQGAADAVNTEAPAVPVEVQEAAQRAKPKPAKPAAGKKQTGDGK